jgi:hypothetical protein
LELAQFTITKILKNPGTFFAPQNSGSNCRNATITQASWKQEYAYPGTAPFSNTEFCAKRKTPAVIAAKRQ